MLKGEDYVLCTNCQEMVAGEDVEKHSKTCVRVCQDRLDPECDSAKYTLQKMRNFLSTLIAKEQPLRPNQRKYIPTLLSLVQDLILAKGHSDVELIEIALQSMTSSFEGPTFQLLLIERIAAIAKELETEIDSQVIETRKQEINDAKTKIERYKRKVHIFEEFLEDTEKPRGGSGHGSENASEADATEVVRRLHSLDYKSSDLKKFFYSQGLAVKMSLPPRNKAQKVSLQALYEYATRSKISVEDWPDFIKTQLQKPEPWLKTSIPRTAPQSFHSAISIPEETEPSEA